MAQIKEYFKTLNTSVLPEKAKEYIDANILTDEDIDLLDENDEDYLEVKKLIEESFPMALKKEKPSEEVGTSEPAYIVEKLKKNIPALEKMVKHLKGQDKINAENKLKAWKSQLKIFEKKIMRDGGGVGSPTNKEVYDKGEVIDSWASDEGGSNESQDNVIEYNGNTYLVSISVEDNQVIRPKAKAQTYEYANGGAVGKERVYIEYMNKDKNFKKDKKYFDSYNEAVKWARENFERFDSDMIKYESSDEYANGGGVDGVKGYEDLYGKKTVIAYYTKNLEKVKKSYPTNTNSNFINERNQEYVDFAQKQLDEAQNK